MNLRLLFLSSVLLTTLGLAQDSSFVRREGSDLTLSGKPFFAVGANCYYLRDLAVQGDTVHLIEVLKTARDLGFTVIRTWAFSDGTDSTDPAVIQFAPGRYNERALRALDYVVAKASQYSLRLVLSLVDNWDYYGGMNQYLRWLGGGSLSKALPPPDGDSSPQRVTSVGGRSYLLRPTLTTVHDDFYRHATIKQWYKAYVTMLLNRINTYTGRAYKNESTIFLWELANEPRSSDPTGELVAGWIEEMASFIKTIDKEHCVGSGEEGHDIQSAPYAAPLIAQQQWMFNGSAGISFDKNIQLAAIDVGSIHFYPEDWGFSPGSVSFWINDHHKLALAYKKPLLVGEVGIRKQRVPFFDAVSSTVLSGQMAGFLFWQLAYTGQTNLDGYQVSCPSDLALCPLLSRIGSSFLQRRHSTFVPPTSVKLLCNYPNPFNYITAITYDIPSLSSVNLEIVDILGRTIVTLVDDRVSAGTHVVLFDASAVSSGVYIARLRVADREFVQKIVLLK